MKKLMVLVILVLIVGVAFSLYVRLAPANVARWHVAPEGLVAGDLEGGAVRIVPAADDTFQKLDQIIRSTPRTQVLAGTVDEGLVTYVTRSAVFGFPDYTTVSESAGEITIHGRLRFGRSDLGVNAKRLDGWLSEL